MIFAWRTIYWPPLHEISWKFMNFDFTDRLFDHKHAVCSTFNDEERGGSATFKSFDRGLPKVIFHLSSDPGFFQDRVARRKKSPEDWKTGRQAESEFSIFLILGLILLFQKWPKFQNSKVPPFHFSSDPGFFQDRVAEKSRKEWKNGRMKESRIRGKMKGGDLWILKFWSFFK